MNNKYKFDLTGPEMNSLLTWLKDYQDKVILSEGDQTISGAKYFSGILSAESIFSGIINNRRGINSETKVSASENLNNIAYNTYLLTDSINSEFLVYNDELRAKFSIYLDNDGQALYKIKHAIYTYDPDYGDYVTKSYDYNLPRDSGTLALQSDAPSYQSTSVVVSNAVTNINGRVFQNYTATLVTSGNYVYYQIYKNDSIVTNKNTAKEYMHYMTGSYFVPEYHYDFPKQTLFVFADRSIWKPQFNETDGLRLYRVSTPLALKSEVDTSKGTKLYQHKFGNYLYIISTKSSYSGSSDGRVYPLYTQGHIQAFYLYNGRMYPVITTSYSTVPSVSWTVYFQTPDGIQSESGTSVWNDEVTPL